MIRVLHAITMLELGGAQRNTLDTVQGLPAHGFETFLAAGPGGELFQEGERLGSGRFFLVPHLVRPVRPFSDLRALGELCSLLRRLKPHILHTHSSKAGVLGRLAGWLSGVPHIVHSIHGFGFGPHQPVPVRAAFLAAERMAARVTQAFVAVSKVNAEEGVKIGLFPRERVRVIRSGIALGAFLAARGGEEVRRELGIPLDAPLVVQVSCFKPQKAPERFLKVAAQLAPRFPEARFLLVGDGELRPLLEKRRRELGLGERLLLPGWRRDIPAVLHAAHVVTLTSRFEGLPRVLVEARAVGRPVVAMAVDGVVEVVAEGVNGFLVAEGDMETMAERVAQLLREPALARQLGERGREGLEEFAAEAMVAQQAALYRELLGGDW